MENCIISPAHFLAWDLWVKEKALKSLCPVFFISPTPQDEEVPQAGILKGNFKIWKKHVFLKFLIPLLLQEDVSRKVPSVNFTSIFHLSTYPSPFFLFSLMLYNWAGWGEWFCRMVKWCIFLLSSENRAFVDVGKKYIFIIKVLQRCFVRTMNVSSSWNMLFLCSLIPFYDVTFSLSPNRPDFLSLPVFLANIGCMEHKKR